MTPTHSGSIHASLHFDQCTLWTTLHWMRQWRAHIDEEWTLSRTASHVSWSISILRSADQLVRRLSPGKDCKFAKILINLEIRPLLLASRHKKLSISKSWGTLGKPGKCLRTKSRTCKYQKKNDFSECYAMHSVGQMRQKHLRYKDLLLRVSLDSSKRHMLHPI